MTDIFSKDALDAQVKEALANPPDLPANTGRIGVVDKNGDIGAELDIEQDLGSKGAFVEAQGSWMRRAGYSAAIFFGWRPKG